MGVLFAYWDYRKAILVIEDELLMFKKTSDLVIGAVHTRELELWGAHKPFLHISDNDLQNIADLNKHGSPLGITFLPTKKDDKELQVNNLR